MLSAYSKFMMKYKAFYSMPMRSIMFTNKRKHTDADGLVSKTPEIAEPFLEESEIMTRIMSVIHAFKLVNLEELDWNKDFEELGLDSLETTAIITSIERNFNVVFEDKIFDDFKNFGQVKRKLQLDAQEF